MKVNDLRIVSLIFITTVILFLTGGCMMAAHDIGISQYPLLHTSIAQAPPLEPGYSRIVVYAPRAPLGGVKLVGVGGFTMQRLTIKGQKSIFSAEILDQTGLFMDIPPGEYQIAGAPISAFDTTKCITVNLAALKTYAIKTNSDIGTMTSQIPVLVDNFEDAIQEMEKNKIRYSPSGATEYTKRLSLKQTLIPEVEAASLWAVSPLPQTRPDSTARIYILNRTFIAGGAARVFAGVDCLPDIEIDKTKYICFETTPGKHILSLKVGFFTKDGAIMGFVVDLKDKEDFFIDFEPMNGKFDYVSQEEAQKLIKNQGKMAKGGYYCVRSPLKL